MTITKYTMTGWYIHWTKVADDADANTSVRDPPGRKKMAQRAPSTPGDPIRMGPSWMPVSTRRAREDDPEGEVKGT